MDGGGGNGEAAAGTWLDFLAMGAGETGEPDGPGATGPPGTPPPA